MDKKVGNISLTEQFNEQKRLAKKKKQVLRVGVISLIIIVIAGIFIIKTISEKNNDPVTDDNIPLHVSSVKLEELKSYNMPIVIDFGADSCIPCKAMAPVLEKLNKEWQGKAIVQFVDVWKYTSAADNFPISLIPTQVFYNADGSPYVPSDRIQESIEFNMYSDKVTGKHIFTVHQGGLTEAEMRRIFSELGVE